MPDGFHFTLLDPDWDHFEQLMAPALARVPALERAGIKQLINGPESFTPDGNFILGEAPELRGFYVGAGFNAFGIAAGGGAGKALAEWIAAGEPPMDLWPVDIRRFGSPHGDDRFVRARTLELYGKHYTIAWPGEEHRSGRPLRRSPLYDRLRTAGAVLRGKNRLRARQLVRPARDRRAARRLQLRPAQLVRGGRPGASGLPRAGRPVRCQLVRQVPAGRARRRAGAVLDLRERRRRSRRAGSSTPRC